MGERTDQIEDVIDQSREDLRANLEELESRVKDVTNWRSMVRRHPAAMVAAAMVGGMLLASLTRR